MFKPTDIIYKPTKRIEIEPLCYFSKPYSSYIQKDKKECQERIIVINVLNAINVIIAINLLFWKQGKKDIWKTVQEGQELFIILITKT